MALTMIGNLMGSITSSHSLTLLATLALSAQVASAHTWIEQMQVIGTNGSYIGDYGYPRGYVARTDSNFDEFINLWQIPSNDMAGYLHINDSMLLCRPSQRKANYSPQWPKLQAAPGSFVAAKYLENGHVTQPWIPAGKPNQTGTVYLFGTYEPKESETLMNVLSWTSDGKGGNGKGWLMSAQSFDDGRCHQLNQRPISINRQIEFGNHPVGQPSAQLEQWCETDFQIPATAPVGSTLSFYWVWSWGTANNTLGAPCGKDEYYTACGDIDVVDGGANLSKLAAAPKKHSLDVGHQDPQTDAVSNYQSRTALTPTPVVTTQGAACNISPTQVATSVAASLTAPTTLPATIPAAMEKHPVLPTYDLPSSLTTAASGSPPQAAGAGTKGTGASSSAPQSTGVYSNSTSSAPRSSSTVTVSATATITSTSFVTSASSASPTSAASSSSTPSISFVTITVTASLSGVAASTPAAAAPASAAAVVVGADNRVQELGRRSHARGGWRFAA